MHHTKFAVLSLRKKLEFFYLPFIIEFGHLEFKFRIRGLKLAKRCKEQIFEE